MVGEDDVGDVAVWNPVPGSTLGSVIGERDATRRMHERQATGRAGASGRLHHSRCCSGGLSCAAVVLSREQVRQLALALPEVG